MRIRILISLAAFFALANPSQAMADDAWLLRNVQILHVDGEEPEIVPDMAILVEDGRIARVGRADEIASGQATRVADGRGRIVMAGLVDMHVHVWDEASLGAYLANGVTTIRNASGMPFHLRLAEAIESGETVGPRLITTGPILNSPGPNQQINHQLVVTEEQARSAVRAQHDAGYRRIKVYSNLTREAYEAILDEARALGMTIMGHTPEGVRRDGMPVSLPFEIGFQEILDDGFVTIEHTESIVWHGLRNLHDEAAARALAKSIAASKTPVDPTLLAFYNLLRVSETNGAYLRRDGTEMLNPLLVAQSQAEYDRWSNEEPPAHRAAFGFYKTMTRIMHEEGVLLVAGSDAGIFTNIPGVSLIDELELLSEAGLDNQSVLRAATLNSAKVLGEADRAGRIAEGMRADFILLDEDPSTDLGALRSISAVVASGKLFEADALAALRASAADHDVGRTQANLIEALEAQGIDPASLGL